jgi:hypothetical protein
MNINLLTCDSNLEPGFTPKNIRAGKMFLAQSLLSIVLWVMTACSVIGRTTLQGTEHLACSPEIHFIDHSVICQKERGGNWVACQASGRVENNGSARVSNVIVTVEFGHVLNDMRSSTINLVGDLDPGEQADFKSDFSYYERLTEYDIKLGCDNSISAQPSPVLTPSPVPSPRIFFTQLLPKRDVFTLAIDPTVPTTIYAGTEWEGVFKSVDGGLTWVPSNTGMVNVKIGALAIDPLETNILYAGTYGTNGNNGAAYKSVDSGESWVEITNGMGGAYVFSLAIDPIATSTIYAGTSDGVFRSTDGGGVWTRLDTGDPDPYITRVVVDPLTPTNLYAVSSGTMQGILKSTNAGHDWSLIRINPDFTYQSLAW